MAEITITRSNRQEVTLLLHSVDRESHQVTIDVPIYNGRFTFTNLTGKMSLISTGRQRIDENQPATSHVSRSVYIGMARWAGAILNDRRQ